MKQIITILIALCITTCAFSQTKVKMINGNFVPATITAKVKSADSTTGKTFTTASGVYPVYQSARGKLYILRTSKNGNVYKQYLKL